ncbi:MAG TPA: DNA-binding protein [Bacteroidales bacterium]|nr:DNA-binding protein [Bacteroidales bacterium]
MDFIIDFNILFSSMLSGKSFYKTLFRNNNFYAPDFIFIELQKYENQILENTKLEMDQLIAYTKFLFNHLKVFPNLVISLKSKQIAFDLIKDIDIKDITYLALSIELNFPLITRDEVLYNGLRNRGYNNIVLFSDFINTTN